MFWPISPSRTCAPAGAALWLALVALLAFLPLAALAPAALLAALLLWPPLALVLAAWAVPFGGLLALPLGAARLTPALPMLILASALALLRALPGGRLPGWGRARPLLLPLACFLAALVLAGWRAPESLLVLQELARWSSLGLALWLAARLGGGEGDGRRKAGDRDITAVFVLLLAAGALEAAWGIHGALLREGPEAYAALGGRIYRAHGHFGQPNPFGGYMNQLWPLALAPLAARLLGLGAVGDRRPAGPGWAVIAWGAVAGALALAGLLLSWSRGAWLGAAAAGAAMTGAALAGAIGGREGGARDGGSADGGYRVARYVARGSEAMASRSPGGVARRRGLLALWLGLCLVLVGLLAGGLERLPRSVVDRLASSAQGGGWIIDVRDAEVTDADFAKIERLAHWQAALAMWAERPWLGQGPGHFAAVYDRFRLPRWKDPLGHAHNLYLNLLAEAGLLGLAGYLLFYCSAWALALRACLRPRAALEAALGLGLVGVLAGLGVHSLLDHLYVHDLAVQLGLGLGLLLAARPSGDRTAVMMEMA